MLQKDVQWFLNFQAGTDTAVIFHNIAKIILLLGRLMRSLPPSTDMKSDTLRSALPAFHLPFSFGTPKKHVIIRVFFKSQCAICPGVRIVLHPLSICPLFLHAIANILLYRSHAKVLCRLTEVPDFAQ